MKNEKEIRTKIMCMLRAMEDKMDKDIGDLELNKQEQNRQRVTGRISEVPGLNLTA